MRVTYRGRQGQFTPPQKKKLDAKLSKLAKLLDQRGGERKAHVILTAERHLRRAEIAVSVYNHPMVGVAAGADQFTAIVQAAQRLETQVRKLRAKKRDTKREAKQDWQEGIPAAGAAPVAEEVTERRIFRVNEHSGRKPMTLEEALLEMSRDRDYLAYRDAGTDRLAVLLRRRDGHFDLIET